MSLFKQLADSIAKHSERNAFFINDTYYTYYEFGKRISAIRDSIHSIVDESQKRIGIVGNDDLDTYAAIIAVWFEGKAYVPLSPQAPTFRNEEMIEQAGLRTIIDSSETSLFPRYNVIESQNLLFHSINLEPKITDGSNLAYIIFTSGSTGVPKGVQITINGLASFMDALFNLGFDIDENDRCLQMFELNFDLSIVSFLVSWLKGGSLYTIPRTQIKYTYIYKLLDEHELTFAVMIPTVMRYLRPYFDEINCDKLKYNLFCGEALNLDITTEWSGCVPKAKIFNVYGPTETTVFCTSYLFDPRLHNKSHNGIISIGKLMEGTTAIIIDPENDRPVKDNEKGELYLAGPRLSPGYIDEEKTKAAFITLEHNGLPERYYKTGDICFKDTEDEFMYLGRADSQVKIQGYRVELSEVEYHAKIFLDKTNAVAMAFTNKSGVTEMGLMIEGESFDTDGLLSFLKNRIPPYMVPSKIRFEKKFPENLNGKTDKKVLLKMLQEQL